MEGIKDALEKIYPKLKKGELNAMEAVVEIVINQYKLIIDSKFRG